MTNLIRRKDVAAIIIKFDNGEEAMVERPSQALFTCDTNFYTKGNGSPAIADSFLEWKLQWTEREGERGALASQSEESNP